MRSEITTIDTPNAGQEMDNSKKGSIIAAWEQKKDADIVLDIDDVETASTVIDYLEQNYGTYERDGRLIAAECVHEISLRFSPLRGRCYTELKSFYDKDPENRPELVPYMYKAAIQAQIEHFTGKPVEAEDQIRSEEIIDFLLKVITDPASSEDLVISALHNISAFRNIPSLSEKIRVNLTRMLGSNLGERVEDAILDELIQFDTTDEIVIEEMNIRLSRTDLAALNDGSKYSLIQSISRMNDPRFVPYLKTFSQDPTDWVRIEAEEAINKLAGRENSNEL